MNNRLLSGAAILAFVAANALLTPAFAQDETGGDAPAVEEVVDPMPADGGEDIGGEVVVDDGVLFDGDGEITVEDGEPVPYGPEGCIDCNVAPTMVDLGGVDRPTAENFRGNDGDGASASTGGKPVLNAIARVESAETLCDIGNVANAAKVCP